MNPNPVNPVFLRPVEDHAFYREHFPWAVSHRKLDTGGVLYRQGDRVSHAQTWCYENFGFHPYRRCEGDGFWTDSCGAWAYRMGWFLFKDQTHATLFKLRWA